MLRVIRVMVLASVCARCRGRAVVPSCFGAQGTGASYSDGTWHLANHSRVRTGRLEPRGKERPWVSCSARRDLVHEWRPNCHLEDMEKPELCTLLKGKFVLLVGDSTSQQLFLSLVSVMHGQLSRGYRDGGRDRASACNDSVRIASVRADLLLWTSQPADLHKARQCNDIDLHSVWTRRAAMADLVLLSVGQHFANFDLAAVATRSADAAARTARLAFFSASLEHTLRSAGAARAAAGHLPDSLVLVGASLPTPGCSRFEEPISLPQWLEAEAATPEGVARFRKNWRQLPRQNYLARWIAANLNVPFLEIGSLTAQRPDATMARARAQRNKTSDAANEDCVHFCLPGPLRDVVKLMGNMLTAHMRGGRLWPQGNSHFRSRAFAVPREDWLGGRKGGDNPDSDNPVALEAVPGMHSTPKQNRSLGLAAKWWWPFGSCGWVHDGTRPETVPRNYVVI